MKVKNKKEDRVAKAILICISLFTILLIIDRIYTDNKTMEEYMEMTTRSRHERMDTFALNLKDVKRPTEPVAIQTVANSEKDLILEIENELEEESHVGEFEKIFVSAQPVNEAKWIWANVSAYCACEKCCGKSNGITASGAKATANHTIAAPSNYKFGTQIEIEGMGIYTVEDRGGAIQGNKFDIYFDSHQDALNFGRKNLQIKVIE